MAEKQSQFESHHKLLAKNEKVVGGKENTKPGQPQVRAEKSLVPEGVRKILWKFE